MTGAQAECGRFSAAGKRAARVEAGLLAAGAVAAGNDRLVRLNHHRHFGACGRGEGKNCGEELQH